MYYPFLRGRQYELLALRELLEKELIVADVIIPIVEPIKETPTFTKTMSTFFSKEYPIYTVINPQVGEFKKHEDSHPISEDQQLDAVLMNDVKEELELYFPYIKEKERFITVYEKRDDLSKTDLFRSYNLQPALNFVPDGTRFKRYFKELDQNVGLIRDAFGKRERNADYAIEKEEFFSDDHLYYSEDGYHAFSDYSIVGASYTEGGFAPLAVAIHIVFFDEKDVLRVKHFVSVTNDDISNPAGKFNEALKQLVEWSKTVEDKNRSEALRQFEELLENKRYPGLGAVKKLSIMHHLEIMNRFLLKVGMVE